MKYLNSLPVSVFAAAVSCQVFAPVNVNAFTPASTPFSISTSDSNSGSRAATHNSASNSASSSTPIASKISPTSTSSTSLQVQSSTAGTGFSKAKITKADIPIKKSRHADLMNQRPDQIKDLLLELLPRMTGTAEEFKKVEDYVNALEEKYLPPTTLGFLNIAMAGEWQFLFTTNQLGNPSPFLRLTELVQTVKVNGLEGTLTNQATWDLVSEGSDVFDTSGTFASSLSYNINQGSRLSLGDDHDLTINLLKGNPPKDTEALVGLLHRAMPTEMFDPSGLDMDTTYLDTDLKIVRFTGARHEGVRNIFVRKGSFQLDPDMS